MKLVPISLSDPVNLDNQVVIRSKPKKIGRSRPHIRPLDKNLIEKAKDLEAVWKAYNTEAYLQLAVNKHVSLGVKGGWEIIGTNAPAVNYIKRRLLEIFTQTEISSPALIRMIMRDLVLYGNAFLVKVRSTEASSGNPITKDGKRLQPIAAYFPQNPRTMQAEKSKQGKLRAWRQSDAEDVDRDAIDEAIEKALGSGTSVKAPEFTIYPLSDVVHFHFNREAGFIFGQPIWLPALQDIMSLRRMEEDVEQLVKRDAYPIIHYKIGNDLYPAEQSEINSRANELDQIAPGEWIISDSREEIDVANTSGGVDVSPYLAYFEARVFAGLNLSPVEVGRGGTINRSTATQIARQRIEQVKDFQRVLEDFFLHYIIYELLSEGNLKIKSTDPDEIKMKFKEIDHTTMIELENHAADMYTKNAIPFEEARKRMDLNEAVDDGDLYLQRVTIPQVEAKAKVKPPTDSVNRSQNQHGKKISTKNVQNDSAITIDSDEQLQLTVDHGSSSPVKLNSKSFPDLTKLEDRLTRDLDEHVETIKENFLLNPNWTVATVLFPLMKLGYVEHIFPYLELFGSEEVMAVVVDKLFRHVDKIWGLGGKKLNDKQATEEELIEAFDFIKGRNRSVARFNLRKTMNMMIARESICESSKITSHSSTCEDKHGVFLQSARFEHVPPWHRNCKCIAEPLQDSLITRPGIDVETSLNDMIREWAFDIGLDQPIKVDDISTGVSVLKGMLQELNNE